MNMRITFLEWYGKYYAKWDRGEKWDQMVYGKAGKGGKKLCNLFAKKGEIMQNVSQCGVYHLSFIIFLCGRGTLAHLSNWDGTTADRRVCT